MPDVVATQVTFHPLGFRRSGSEWIVGRADTGDFVAVGEAGARALRLLDGGASVQETRRALRTELGQDLDVESFVHALCGIGVVRSVDGRDVDARPAPKPTCAFVRAVHVRWLLSPLLHVLLGATALTGLVAAAVQPRIIPGWSDVLWSEHGTLVLLAQTSLAWALVLVHELAHLFTARAAGVGGTVRLGTRLQFLVAQTDVSGIWLADRRTRMAVYLSGMVLDAAIAGACLTLMALTGPSPLPSLVVLTQAVALVMEFMVFVRTDVYYVLQDLTGCRNMYTDATRYLAHLGRKAVRRATAHPLAGMRALERRVLRVYTAVLVLGTTATLAIGVSVMARVTWPLTRRAAHTLAVSSDGWDVADAATTLGITAGVLCLWAGAWWRRHGPRLRRLVRRGRPAPGSGGG